MNDIIKFVTEHYAQISTIILALYEILVRVFPTGKNRSLIDLAWKIINAVLPNKKDDGTKRTIKMITFFVLLTTVSAYSQTVGTFQAVRYGKGSPPTTGVDTVILNANPTQYPIGTLIREINSDSLYYKFPDGFWHPLVGGGSGGSGLTTADNGLTVNPAGNVQLGGELLDHTNITGASFDLSFNTNSVMLQSGAGAIITAGSSGNIDMNATAGGVLMDASDFINIQTANTLNLTSTAGTASLVGDGTVGVFSNNGDVVISAADELDISSINNTVISGSGVGVTATSGNIQLVTNVQDISLASADEILLGAGGGTTAINMSTVDVNLFTSAGTIDFTSTNFSLNGNLPSSPTTEFFRGDGTWAVPAGGGASPGGANTNVQFNNAGAFGGNASFTYNSAGQIQLSNGGEQVTVSDVGVTFASTNPLISNNSGDIFLQGANNATMTAVSGDATIFSTTGNVVLNPRQGGGAGDILLQSSSLNGSYIIMTGLPANCTGAPTGALANVGGTLTVCP